MAERDDLRGLEREKVGQRYVSPVIRLAFLAPEIVEQIVNGCQPPELNMVREFLNTLEQRALSAAGDQGSSCDTGIDNCRLPEFN
jgi:hypothetical protein